MPSSLGCDREVHPFENLLDCCMVIATWCGKQEQWQSSLYGSLSDASLVWCICRADDIEAIQKVCTAGSASYSHPMNMHSSFCLYAACTYCYIAQMSGMVIRKPSKQGEDATTNFKSQGVIMSYNDRLCCCGPVSFIAVCLE